MTLNVIQLHPGNKLLHLHPVCQAELSFRKGNTGLSRKSSADYHFTGVPGEINAPAATGDPAGKPARVHVSVPADCTA
jgi:hypothetical protein